MEIHELQEVLRGTYFDRDRARGQEATFRWLVEEVGELAKAMRTGGRDELVHEFGDVLAWLMSLANVQGIELEDAAARYARGCPKCTAMPCTCKPG